MAFPLIKHRITVEEFDRMGVAGVFEEGSRLELIHGEIVEMTPIGASHQSEVDRLNDLFTARLGRRVQVRVQGPVHVGRHSEPQPDLLLLKRRDDFYRHVHPGPRPQAMLKSMRTSIIPAGELVSTADQRIVIYGVPWSHFEAQLALRGEASVPRIAYLGGALELMRPSRDHERIKSVLRCLVEAYALDAGFTFTPYGGWTLKKQVREAGAEPDECYTVGPEQDAELPDLVIEVVWTSGGLDKLEIYKRIGVGEFWQWRDGRIDVFILRRGRYERVLRSKLFPELDLEHLLTFLDRPSASDAIRAFRASLAGAPLARRPARKRRR